MEVTGAAEYMTKSTFFSIPLLPPIVWHFRYFQLIQEKGMMQNIGAKNVSIQSRHSAMSCSKLADSMSQWLKRSMNSRRSPTGVSFEGVRYLPLRAVVRLSLLVLLLKALLRTLLDGNDFVEFLWVIRR